MSHFSTLSAEIQHARSTANKTEAAAFATGGVTFFLWVFSLIFIGTPAALVLSIVSLCGLTVAGVLFLLSNLARAKVCELQTKPHARKLTKFAR